MARTASDGLASGFTLGVAIAFSFALVIRVIPEGWLLDTRSLALLYALQVPSALLFVPIARGVATRTGETVHRVLLWACCGALAFDGLVLGFWPGLYGHIGEARSAVATLLLWAFAWIVAAALTQLE